MERRRRSPSVGITRGGGKYIPFVKGGGGGWGSSPKKISLYDMSVKAILIHFEAILSCESKLILQALSYISNAYDSFFETRPLMSVLTTISTPRRISSGGCINLATGVIFSSCFWFFVGGSFIHQVSISFI